MNNDFFVPLQNVATVIVERGMAEATGIPISQLLESAMRSVIYGATENLDGAQTTDYFLSIIGIFWENMPKLIFSLQFKPGITEALMITKGIILNYPSFRYYAHPSQSIMNGFFIKAC